jgi:hypothetical protein
MRIETRHQRRHTAVPGRGQRPADNRLMAQMKAIEIAERDNAAPAMLRQGRSSCHSLHGRGV